MADVKPNVAATAPPTAGAGAAGAQTAGGATLAISKKTFSNHIEAFYKHWQVRLEHTTLA